MPPITSLPRPDDHRAAQLDTRSREDGIARPALDVTDALDTDARADGGEGTLDEVDGWRALALATHGRPLAAAELTAARLLPIEVALDLLFPTLDDAARHEAMWALDASPDSPAPDRRPG